MARMIKADWAVLNAVPPKHARKGKYSGEISYQCKLGRHDVLCVKLTCPCKCHKK